jgi:hypothetical protein
VILDGFILARVRQMSAVNTLLPAAGFVTCSTTTGALHPSVAVLCSQRSWCFALDATCDLHLRQQQSLLNSWLGEYRGYPSVAVCLYRSLGVFALDTL